MNIDLEDGEVKSDEEEEEEEEDEKRTTNDLNSDVQQLEDGELDVIAESKRPSYKSFNRFSSSRFHNRKARRRRRSRERKMASVDVITIDDDDNNEDEQHEAGQINLRSTAAAAAGDDDEVDQHSDNIVETTNEQLEDDDVTTNASLNPFDLDQLDPQMIELKIKALKSLFADKQSSTSSVVEKSSASKSKRRKSRDEKERRSTAHTSDITKDDADLDVDHRIHSNPYQYREQQRSDYYLDKEKMSLEDYEERLLAQRSSDNYDLTDMDIEIPTAGLYPLQQQQKQHSPPLLANPQSSSILSSQMSSLIQQASNSKGTLMNHPGMAAAASNYSNALLQTQLVQDQLLYKYYQTAGLRNSFFSNNIIIVY